jgi:hypothetical protein
MNARTALIALLLAAACGGCENGRQSSVESGADNEGDAASRQSPYRTLVARPDAPIPDLPVPIGFDFEEDESTNVTPGTIRFLDHVYTGREDKFAVARFYLREMPRHDWTLEHDLFIRGDRSMDFTRPGEACRVRITGGGGLSRTRVRILLWPTSRP